jgi:hypothetical protein
MKNWQGRTTITNPPAMHILRPGDKIIVLGKFYSLLIPSGLNY